MKNRKGQKLFLCLSLFLLTIASYHIFFPQLNCWKLLLQGKKNSYLQFQPLNGDVLYTELSEAAGNQWSVILSSPSINEVIVPKKDIYYYNSPNSTCWQTIWGRTYWGIRVYYLAYRRCRMEIWAALCRRKTRRDINTNRGHRRPSVLLCPVFRLVGIVRGKWKRYAILWPVAIQTRAILFP